MSNPLPLHYLYKLYAVQYPVPVPLQSTVNTSTVGRTVGSAYRYRKQPTPCTTYHGTDIVRTSCENFETKQIGKIEKAGEYLFLFSVALHKNSSSTDLFFQPVH